MMKGENLKCYDSQNRQAKVEVGRPAWKQSGFSVNNKRKQQQRPGFDDYIKL